MTPIELIIIIVGVLFVWFLLPKLGRFVGNLVVTTLSKDEQFSRFYFRVQRRNRLGRR